MAVFLSNEWFNKVEDLTTAAGDLKLPPTLANLALNFVVNENGNKTELSLVSGKFEKALSSKANTTLTLDAQTLRKVFLEFDISAAMAAFMGGKIQIAGDMSQLMALQTASPSAEQKDLFKKILAITE